MGCPGFAVRLFPEKQGAPKGAAAITRRRLNPDTVENASPQDAPGGYAVQSYASGQAEILQIGLPPDMPRHAEHDFLGHILNRAGQIHVTLGQARLWTAWRPAQEPLKRT